MAKARKPSSPASRRRSASSSREGASAGGGATGGGRKRSGGKSGGKQGGKTASKPGAAGKQGAASKPGTTRKAGGAKRKSRGGSKSGAKPAGKLAPRLDPDTPRETFRGLQLNDFQMAALGPLREGRPVLLAAPTGAGKTLVAELAIDMSLKAGKRAIYTAPIKALSNQKFRDFRAIDPDMVGLMTGDVTINPSAPVLIMTTEIFRNTIFENPASLSDVDAVVFDEIHYMDDPDRGTVWEESIIFAPKHIRFVCLSATVSNLAQYGEWISQVRGNEVAVIRHTERPVPLAHYMWFPGHGLSRLDGRVKFPKGFEQALAENRRRGGRGRRPQRKTRGPKHDPNAVIDTLARQGDLPILFFCFSRKDCERRAHSAALNRDLLSDTERKQMDALFHEVCETFEMEPGGDLEELHSLILKGIAYHHAGMLPLHKELVERLFTSGLLRLLFATETFSLGINMPARAVVFASLRKFDGTGFSTMKVREYQQMAGRAGRQGIDEHGLVISIIDDHRVQPQDIERLVSNDVEQITSRFNLSYSTLINLHATLGDKLHEAWERSFNNFQWSSMSRKKREKNEEKQRRAIEQRMTLLREFGYIDDEGMTPKGKLASTINGYELQIVELVDSGLLDWLDETQLAIVFAAITFEARKNDLFRRLPNSVMGGHRRDVERCVDRLIAAEKELAIPASIRPPNFKVGVIVHGWCLGLGFDEMREDTTAPPGDMVRVMRLTVQLLRQLRGGLPHDAPLVKTLDRARDLLNRSEVDAARQLTLG